jgi:uncharacterized protein (UPF0212 family)
MPVSGRMYYWGDKAKFVTEEPGVYAFYDKNQNLIYVGKSANLREDFTHYLETDFSEDPCKRETAYYKREITSDQENRVSRLLEEYRQEHGELPKCNRPPRLSEKEVEKERGFHFYEGIGKPLNEVAVSLRDLRNKIRVVPSTSLEFHIRRGDFSEWVKVVLEDPQVAEAIQKVNETGEELRTGLLNVLKDSDAGAPEVSTSQASCPACGTESTPVKTWKMAGRPNKNGERLQLTIGYYRCSGCGKAFRKVLAKKKVKAP